MEASIALSLLHKKYFLFFMACSLFFARSYGGIRLLLLLPLLFFTTYYFCILNIKHNKYIIICYSYLIILFSIFSILGGLNANVLDSFRVMVLWIVVFYILFLNFQNKMDILFFLNISMIIGGFISIYNILFVTLPFFNIDSRFLEILDPQARWGIHEGYLQLTAHNIGMLLFTFPMTFIYFICGDFKINNKINVFILLLLQLFTIIISGRRILLFSVILCLFLMVIYKYIFYKYLRKNKKMIFLVILLVLTFLLFLNIYQIDIGGFVDRILGVFNRSEQSKRRGQIKDLKELLPVHPFFGYGLGGEAIEISYIRLLLDMGIVGFSLFLLYIFFISIYGISIALKMGKEFFLPICFLTGFLSFLLGCATNPYIFSFDFIWILVIPINVFIVLNKKTV